MKITFCGGAMSVTGANYLLEQGSLKILVDCGLFQGSKYAEKLNDDPFSYDPKTIDYLLITHSHTDHIGRIPKLYRDGFRGKILVVEPTRDLMERAFPDNWSRMAEEAKADNHPPLYEITDIAEVMRLVGKAPYHKAVDLEQNVTTTFYNAGHILGSAIVGLEYEGDGQKKKIYFSGDLGNSPSLLLPDKEFVEDADYLVIESAYGSRIHEKGEERSQILRKVAEHVIAREGALMIPSFAIERTQEILFELHKLFSEKIIPEVPVFIDSPLANKMTEVYERYPQYLKPEARAHLVEQGGGIFNFSCLRHTESVEESKAINNVPPPKIIIAGSGMSNGGRILHHERRYLSDPNSAIVFVGYQVEGSLGRRILDGAEDVSIFGEKVSVHCLVRGIGGYSAHADQPALTEWAGRANQAGRLSKIFVVQGEEISAKSLADSIEAVHGLKTVVPTPNQKIEL